MGIPSNQPVSSHSEFTYLDEWDKHQGYSCGKAMVKAITNKQSHLPTAIGDHWGHPPIHNIAKLFFSGMVYGMGFTTLGS